jgi:Na+-translocating ferredoxin:NAD+ oxidoreductase RNF subunit RnfB
MSGEGCSRLSEACLLFDEAADIYLRNGLGRTIRRSEALAILVRANKEGMVLQPGNSQKPMNICCCCGCCCGVLRNLKAFPKPARLASSAFMAVFNRDFCTSCEECVSRCQMGALQVKSAEVCLDQDRCIGCGLCVSTCPTGCLTLARKPDSAQARLPKDSIHSMIELGRARGKIQPSNLAWMLVKSKLERLLAVAGR